MNNPHELVASWEPPMAASEVEHVLATIKRLRTTFRWKVSGVNHEGMTYRIGQGNLTLGGLVKHMAIVEDFVFTHKLTGSSLGEPWDSTFDESVADWEFVTASQDSPEELIRLWDEAVVRANSRIDNAISTAGLDQLIWISDPNRGQASLRRLMFDFIEEYGRHTGHADLIRENIDGLVGEDPPADWVAPDFLR